MSWGACSCPLLLNQHLETAGAYKHHMHGAVTIVGGFDQIGQKMIRSTCMQRLARHNSQMDAKNPTNARKITIDYYFRFRGAGPGEISHASFCLTDFLSAVVQGYNNSKLRGRFSCHWFQLRSYWDGMHVNGEQERTTVNGNELLTFASRLALRSTMSLSSIFPVLSLNSPKDHITICMPKLRVSAARSEMY